MPLILACSTPPTPVHVQHLDALASEDPAACARIDDADVRGECTVQVMLLRNRADPEACDALPDSAWRHECFFFAADNTDRPFEERWALCDLTGPFVEDCHVHQAETEAARLAELGRPLDEVPMREHPRVVQGYERARAKREAP